MRKILAQWPWIENLIGERTRGSLKLGHTRNYREILAPLEDFDSGEPADL
jgi:hypothetical protein